MTTLELANFPDYPRLLRGRLPARRRATANAGTAARASQKDASAGAGSVRSRRNLAPDK